MNLNWGPAALAGTVLGVGWAALMYLLGHHLWALVATLVATVLLLFGILVADDSDTSDDSSDTYAWEDDA